MSLTKMFGQLSLNPNEIFEQAEQALQQRRVSDALNFYRIAEAQGFDADACCGARWVCHMLLGDFCSAWQESDAIERHGRPDLNRFWDGKPLEGQRVLIRCLHGLGDTIQYLRYAPLLRKQAVDVTIETQPALKRLVQRSGLADNVITWGESEPPWDRQIEIIELPRLFQTTLETIPGGVPYLKSAPREALTTSRGKLRVGLVWASSRYNTSRSVPLARLSALCETPEVDFYSFQGGDNREELRGFDPPIQDAFDRSGCVQAAADGLAAMHLLITVDTMMAHLAGALGHPVWTLLPFQADWRWMLHRNDSPWYPTMRLFRQTAEGDWSAPISDIRVELQRLVSERFVSAGETAGTSRASGLA